MKNQIILLLLLSNVSFSVVAIPTIQHWQTQTGASVYFVPAPDLPMIDIEITFDAGNARDGDKLGIADLTNDLLNEGAGDYTVDEIAETLENIGAELSLSVSHDRATISLRSLTEENLLQPAVNMLAILLAQANFNSTAFNRVKQQMIVALEYQQQSPATIAKKAFYKAIFTSHPYANLKSGTLESIQALTYEDVQAFYKNYYVAKNMTIAMVGAINRKQAEQLAEKISVKLPAGEKAMLLPAVAALTQAQEIHIDYPSTQTHILIGQPGLARGEADYFVLYVGNYILGGSGLVSQLSQEVREKRGLSYSTYSYFFPRRVAGPFIVSAKTRNKQAEQAIEVVMETLVKFVKNGPTETELNEAKQSITGGFPLRIAENSNIIAYLSIIGFYNLPLDYLHKFNDKIEAVTLEMIKKAFKTKLHLDKLVTVTVGKKIIQNDN